MVALGGGGGEETGGQGGGEKNNMAGAPACNKGLSNLRKLKKEKTVHLSNVFYFRDAVEWYPHLKYSTVSSIILSNLTEILPSQPFFLI